MTLYAPDRPSLAAFGTTCRASGDSFCPLSLSRPWGPDWSFPFGFIYLHEVRRFTIETTGSMLAVPAIVGMAVVGPPGALIDRLGARRIILAGMTAQMLGNVLLAFSPTSLSAALAPGLLGAAGASSGRASMP